jgi:hypothetical protein
MSHSPNIVENLPLVHYLIDPILSSYTVRKSMLDVAGDIVVRNIQSL